ncbi:MAG: hypothetical protein J5I93_25370 [Pirellulaceae bacterium]|nr:hypothetical protein [Pirellulaceae bacterium]
MSETENPAGLPGGIRQRSFGDYALAVDHRSDGRETQWLMLVGKSTPRERLKKIPAGAKSDRDSALFVKLPDQSEPGPSNRPEAHLTTDH